MKKRLLSMILAISMMLTILPVNAITAWAADDKSGVCGDGLTYTMIQNGGTDTYTLAITKSGTGTGAMTDYSYSSGYKPVPWYAECDKITKLTIAGATSIGKSAFEDCHKLADVTISGSVTSIGEQAFEGCQALTNTSISNILKEATSIGEGAFRGCTSLTSVEIPKSVTSIDVAAFSQCSNLTSVKILGTITSIAASTFIDCGKLNNFDIPDSVTSIGDWAFARCSGFADIKIPEKVTSIGNHAFEKCTSLTTIKIPDSVTSIGENAFNGCSSLRQVDLPYNIPTISKDAFNNANTRFYYRGYAKDFNAQVGKIATGNTGMQTYLVCCYRDVLFDANGGSFADSSTQKKVEKIWRETRLTQVQVDSIGAPKQSGKIFLGWNTTANATTTINPIYGDTADGTIYYAVYKDAVPATVTISGPTDNTVKAGEGSNVFTVAANKGDTDAAKAKFDFAGGKVQYRTGDTEEWVDLTSNELSIDNLTGKQFRVVPDADAATAQKTLTVKLMDASGNEIAGATASTVFAVTARKPAEVTINGLDNTTVKAGEAQEFTVSVTPNDDANTGAKATITVSGANADAVEKIQYKDGETWKDVPGEGLSIDKINNTEFKLITKADANDGDVTITVTANKANGTEIDKKVAAVTVKKHENAAVTIDGLDGTTVKAGEAKEFTVNVTPNDDANTGAKATITVSGANADAVEKIQYKDGETWKDVPGEGLSIDKINNTEFKLITKADANDGDVTITVTANKANGTEIDKKVAAVTVTKKEEPVTPGGGSTGGGEIPGENPGGGSGNTNPTPKPDEKPDRKIKIDGGIVEVNGKEVKPDEDGNITVKKGDEITITVDKSKISDAQVFDQWVIKPDSVLNEVDPKSEKISFTMPAEDVTIEAMTRDASIEDDGPGILGTGALIATGVVGSAALLYQGHMLGTELYLRYLLPHGAVIPQNRAELAVLLWQDAENPEPVSTTLYSDISEDDSAIQQAARWAVENDLMEQLDAEEHPDHFDPFVPVTFSDSIRAWKKAQELKK